MSEPGPATVPRLAPGVRLRHDRVRDTHVLLAPERMFAPDETALAVLQLVDGQANVAAIIATLAARFAAPADEISADVTELLADLRQRGAITWSP